ncbi:hypothetical protein [Evansella cellulosilytica]|uniref:Uncharacterized protein n=1 Tax=Evansella cellulosilytica (strain ATCC 21833 / DSM 2522 / FERM P-1141 / JCM 9156 / N-4) TaxID=649639 RepID=E6TRG5_EVAC2|nr:hypothetical protein [Evansella cellulosilytica]ADU31795.1 hypothetical protein Bcell_3554 [Evansella cellulosilytica DSM 2522]
MDPQVRQRINSIIWEANAIAKEIDEISHGINQEFKGVSAGQSRLSLQEVADAYRKLSNEFRRLT